MPEFPVVDLSNNVDRRLVERAERDLSRIRNAYRASKEADELLASDLLQVILILREALE